MSVRAERLIARRCAGALALKGPAELMALVEQLPAGAVATLTALVSESALDTDGACSAALDALAARRTTSRSGGTKAITPRQLSSHLRTLEVSGLIVRGERRRPPQSGLRNLFVRFVLGVDPATRGIVGCSEAARAWLAGDRDALVRLRAHVRVGTELVPLGALIRVGSKAAKTSGRCSSRDSQSLKRTTTGSRSRPACPVSSSARLRADAAVRVLDEVVAGPRWVSASLRRRIGAFCESAFTSDHESLAWFKSLAFKVQRHGKNPAAYVTWAIKTSLVDRRFLNPAWLLTDTQAAALRTLAETRFVGLTLRDRARVHWVLAQNSVADVAVETRPAAPALEPSDLCLQQQHEALRRAHVRRTVPQSLPSLLDARISLAS